MSDTTGTIHSAQQSAPNRPSPDSAEARVAQLDGVEHAFISQAGAAAAKLGGGITDTSSASAGTSTRPRR